MLAWSKLEVLIGEAERVMLTTHVRPDGDALGSELAMADLLTQRGKEVQIFNSSPTPARYKFFDPDGSRVQFQTDGVGLPTIEPDLIIVLDTGTWSQLAGLADYVRQSSAKKVVIDHHCSQDDLGALQLVETRAAACGMLVYEAFQQIKNVELTEHSAEALFVAIATDTGWMRHSSTHPIVLETLGHLVAAGAKPHRVFQELYETNSIGRMRLLAKLLEGMEVSLGGRLIWSTISQQQIRDAGAHPMDTEDFINHLMTVAGVESALVFIEQEKGGVKVSFRTRGTLDCATLAENFGGGGHKPAAGAFVNLPLEQAVPKVVAATEAAMST